MRNTPSRKVGGRYLYEQYRERGEAFTKEYFLELYKSKLGKYNLVLKKENDKLKKFQKIKKGSSREEFLEVIENVEKRSYDSAGISLKSFSPDKYATFKKMKSKKKN